MQIDAHEMVETIIFSYLKSQRTAGAFGCLRVSPDRVFTVTTCCGKVFEARNVRGGWAVKHNGYEGIDSSLIDAAWLATHP